MKKLSLLIAMIALVCGNAFAQMSYDFNDGMAGAKIAQTYGMPWTTWTNNPGSAEDGVFDEAGGSMAAHFTYGNDQILYLGDHEVGVYDLEFDAYVPNGKNGYFNVLHHFDGQNSNNCIWAIQVYMHMTNDGQNSTAAPNHGTVHAGSTGTADLPCVYDQWMHFRVHVDADNDLAQLYFNVVGEPEVMYAEWQWSLDSFGENTTNRILGAMDFFPPENAANSEYYIDNLTVTLQSNDVVLLSEPFEEYTVGEKIAAASQAAGHDWWTTWSNAPGGNEDGVVASYGESQCGHLTYGNDQVLLLGDEENGNYDLEFDILIPEGKNGYFNILHHFAGSNSTWAMQCYLHLTNDGNNSTSAPGQGTIHAGSNSTATLTNVVYDQWMHFRLNVDTDTDVANYYYTDPTTGEEELVCTWQWSLDSFGNNTVGRTLAAMNFYPPENAETSEYYLDNFSFKKIGGESAPHLAFTPEQINIELGEDDMINEVITLENSGNSIADWSGWIEFGQGEAGTGTAQLYYHNNNTSTASGIGSADAYSREMAIRLPASNYAALAMGMKITSAKFYINPGAQAADGNYTFRVYGQGLRNQPGELLAEKVVHETGNSLWVEATFDEEIYMTGQAMWVSVALEQNAGEYPMTMDDSNNPDDFDGNWLSTNGNTFSHCSGDQFHGAWMITANCQGGLVPATWVTTDKYEGAIMGGTSEDITLTFNTIGIGEDSEYHAVFSISTNDEDLPRIEIPLNLVADITAVAENNVNGYEIYPNPATTSVTLKGENLNCVAIYNVAGQLVRVVNLSSVVNTIEMNVEAGIYFFSIYDNNGGNTVQRVVITK